MRYRLRTLLILLAVLPPMVALAWFNVGTLILAVVLLLLIVSLTALALAFCAVAAVILDSSVAFAARLCSRK